MSGRWEPMAGCGWCLCGQRGRGRAGFGRHEVRALGATVVTDLASWADCVELVNALPMGEPFTLDGLLNVLGERRGKPIVLVPAQLGATAPCGLLARTDDVDYICCPRNTSIVHLCHIAFHELGHVLCGHKGRPVTVSPDDDLEVLQRFMPDLSPSLIRRLLSRTSYGERDELEAEQFATLAGARLQRMIIARSRAGPHSMDVDRLRTLFDVIRVDDRG